MAVQLPREALQRIQIGQSFAEYDIVRSDPKVFVVTPASLVAVQPENAKCFFVGRRGSGKTAISYKIVNDNKRSVQIAPQVFDLIELPLEHTEFRDTRQRPFRSLVCAFERALLGELVRQWNHDKVWKFQGNEGPLHKDRGLIESCDFDTRVLSFTREIFEAYEDPNERLWLRQIKRSEEMIREINSIRRDRSYDYVFLIDRLDEAWDGSDSAVISLMALMHSCVHLIAACPAIRPYLFLRENIYSRIRNLDNEFSRLETSVVFLDWTKEKLVELVERRLVRPFNTRPALGGEAWSHFFKDSASFNSQKTIFGFCQNRPRDVLTYVSFTLEAAISKGHTTMEESDITDASERFSTSKLKDLADEFAENYPNIQIVLSLFYGLSTDYTLTAIENLIQKLLVDRRVKEYCSVWFYEHSTPDRFVEVLFNIGFLGVRDNNAWFFKTAGGDGAFLPALEKASAFRVHPAYHAALHLRDLMLTELSDSVLLQESGILEELPSGVNFDEYQRQVKLLLSECDKIPHGHPGANRWEEFVGDVIRLCFFRGLTNVQPKSRNHNQIVIRDWIASNRASSGFWEMIRAKYDATQIIWECKNYDELSADDFHQANYYMSNCAGRFVIFMVRGEEYKKHWNKHVERISKERNGLVLILTEKDTKVFLRQAANGKSKEDHIHDVYDRTVRTIS